MAKIIERLQGKSGELLLKQNGEHYEIISGGVFLMSTFTGEGEREMVRIALSCLSSKGPLKVLMGGLGVGYSIIEALKDKRVKNVDVVELEEAVIEWNKKYLTSFNGSVLTDERVKLICCDLVDYLEMGLDTEDKKDEYQLVIFDVDNGPDWLVRSKNSRLYQVEGLYLASWVLSPGGVLAVWSATKNDSLLQYLQKLYKSSLERVIYLKDEKGREYKNYLYFGFK